MSDETTHPDVIESLGDEVLTFGDLEDLQDNDEVERAAHMDTIKIDGVKKVSAFVLDFGDRSYGVEYDGEAWQVIEETQSLGDAIALFDDE